MKRIIIRNAIVVNENISSSKDILIEGQFITQIGSSGSILAGANDELIDATGLHLFPGCIDDQVHFREPGLTHKGEIYTEAKSAVAGGITSYMEMPNTSPPATSIELLEEKYARAAEVSLANYSFFMGTTNHNIEELLKVNPKNVCGVKVFMGSSTGDMLVDNRTTLERIFSEVKTLIAAHCEDDPMIKENLEKFKAEYGEDIPMRFHHLVRSEDACYKSSSMAVELARKHNARLHVLHISTAKELALFSNELSLVDKKITCEACIHHLWFTNEDYETKGTFIKWNPAVKTKNDRDAIREAVRNGTIDVVATDHAPHTLEEKQSIYTKAPSGGPLVQHALVAMLEMYHQGVFSLELIAKKMAHDVATLFEIDRRGFIRVGYYADLVLVDLNLNQTVSRDNLFYKCQWSPFEGQTFKSTVLKTVVNGHIVFDQGKFYEEVKGERLLFNR